MKIKDILKGDTSLGSKVELNCFIVAASEKVYLLDDEEASDLDNALDISNSWVWDCLEYNVPPLGGGPWAYHDDCKVSLEVFDSRNIVISMLEIKRDRLIYHLEPELDIRNYSTNLEIAQSHITENGKVIESLVGFLVLDENGAVTLNSQEDYTSPENIALTVTMPNIQDVVSEHFYGDSNCPGFYSALVVVNAKVNIDKDGNMTISDILEWEVIYPEVKLIFSDIGNSYAYIGPEKWVL